MPQLLVFGPQGEPIVLDDAEARSLCAAGVFSLTKPNSAEPRTNKTVVSLQEAVCPTCGRRIDDEEEDEEEEHES